MSAVMTELLLAVSNALLVPNILLLFAFLLLTALHLGGLFTEALERRRHGPAFWNLVQELKRGASRSSTTLPSAYGLPRKGLAASKVPREKLIEDLELEAERILGRLLLGIRLGPMLGLAGTLIPLGPALVALSTGDIETLSQKLVVAFTTTVLGLLVGAVSFAMHSVKQRWYDQDLSDIEFVLSATGERP